MQVVAQNFVATALTPLTITHGLGTTDFTYTVKDANLLIEVDINIIDANSIDIVSTADIADGRIVIQAKI
jgi:hypothetical protein